jgi:threonyl-tRNA synthetase
VIEKKMREIIQRNAPFTKEVWSRDKARRSFADMGEAYKVELVDAIPEDQDLKIYKQGEWFDLCRGPHMDSTGQDRFGLQADEGGRRLLARRFQQADADPHLRHRLGQPAGPEAYLHMLEEAEKRDHRKLGREMDLFHFQEEGPGVVFWHAKGWRMFQNLLSYMRRRIEGHL